MMWRTVDNYWKVKFVIGPPSCWKTSAIGLVLLLVGIVMRGVAVLSPSALASWNSTAPFFFPFPNPIAGGHRLQFQTRDRPLSSSISSPPPANNLNNDKMGSIHKDNTNTVRGQQQEEEAEEVKRIPKEEEKKPPPAVSTKPLEPPEKPLPGDCCGSGCVRCVWDIYYEELDEYNKSLSNSDSPPSNW